MSLIGFKLNCHDVLMSHNIEMSLRGFKLNCHDEPKISSKFSSTFNKKKILLERNVRNASFLVIAFKNCEKDHPTNRIILNCSHRPNIYCSSKLKRVSLP